MDLGTRLRRARESQGSTLRQIGDITKLSMTTLQRIEKGEFNALPGGILIKGYLRAYAAAVGLAPEEIVREYLALYADELATEPLPAAPSSDRRRSGATILVLAVAVAAAVAAYSWQTRSGERMAASPAAPEAGAEGSSPLAGATDPNAVRAAQLIRLTLDIQAAGICWVSVSVDGKRTIHRLFQPGDQASVSAEDELVLRVGEPGVFAYRLNGVRGRPLGESGQPVTVTITRENYESFLAPDIDARRRVSAKLT
jgi:cytoskeletal protein RodZ